MNLGRQGYYWKKEEPVLSEETLDEIGVRLKHSPRMLYTGVQGLKFKVSSLKFALFPGMNLVCE
jgi:hypothetical protein